MSKISSSALIHPRLLTILILGFASGLPIALVGSTLQAWFTEANISVVAIGALSLISIPYTFKFLWAPALDHYALPLFGRRRGWILLAQIGLVISLFILANMDPSGHAKAMGAVALIVAFFSATQDTAITAYQTDVLTTRERGLGAAYYIFTYRIATMIAGGLALIFADHIGWKLTYEIMAVLILLSLVLTLLAPKIVEPEKSTQHVFHTVKSALVDLMQRDKIVLLFLFIMFYKFGSAFALLLMTNFLLHGLGFTLSEVGVAFKIVGFAATVLGAFVGGVFLTRFNIYIALMWFGLAQALSNFMFVILAVAGKSFMLMAVSIFIENFCGGLSTAALLAFIMSLCNQRYTASQFALLSSIDSIARVFMGPVAGLLVAHYGWVNFYVCAFILSFPGIIFLIMLKNEVTSYVPVTNN